MVYALADSETCRSATQGNQQLAQARSLRGQHGITRNLEDMVVEQHRQRLTNVGQSGRPFDGERVLTACRCPGGFRADRTERS